MQPIITENRDKIVELCRTHHVRRLSVFGSAVRDDFDPANSDVDLLVEFGPLGEMEYAPNFFSLMRSFDMLFGREVDLVTDKYIENPYFRRAVDDSKVALYVA